MAFLTASEQRMINSPTFCEILLTENIFIRYSGRKMPDISEKSGFCQNFLWVFKKFGRNN
jgi:hypothetical protein